MHSSWYLSAILLLLSVNHDLLLPSGLIDFAAVIGLFLNPGTTKCIRNV